MLLKVKYQLTPREFTSLVYFLTDVASKTDLSERLDYRTDSAE